MDLTTAIRKAIKEDRWMIRASNNGVSYEGFVWNKLGEWTECPDWDPNPVCGGGLHGQSSTHGGFISMEKRLEFCETDGAQVPIGLNKIKVKRARILLINLLPSGLKVGGSLNLSNTQIKELPSGSEVGGFLNLSNTQIKELPSGLEVGGFLNLCNTQIKELPSGLKVGGSIIGSLNK